MNNTDKGLFGNQEIRGKTNMGKRTSGTQGIRKGEGGMDNSKAGKLAERELTGRIIDAAIRVHRTLGPGFIESVYEEALCIELKRRNIPFERQKSMDITYRGKPIGQHRLDLFVADRAVVELKTVKTLEPIHFSIVRSYMKAMNTETGLIFNFAAMPLTIKRVGRELRERE